MHCDGELTAFVRGAPIEKFRHDLWTEYWGQQTPDPAKWRDGAEQRAKTATIGSGAEVVLPLHWSDFPRDLEAVLKVLPIGPRYAGKAIFY
jgi:hypothetical protein